jgi:hypothetical protein
MCALLEQAMSCNPIGIQPKMWLLGDPDNPPSPEKKEESPRTAVESFIGHLEHGPARFSIWTTH